MATWYVCVCVCVRVCVSTLVRVGPSVWTEWNFRNDRDGGFYVFFSTLFKSSNERIERIHFYLRISPYVYIPLGHAPSAHIPWSKMGWLHSINHRTISYRVCTTSWMLSLKLGMKCDTGFRLRTCIYIYIYVWFMFVHIELNSGKAAGRFIPFTTTQSHNIASIEASSA